MTVGVENGRASATGGDLGGRAVRGFAWAALSYVGTRLVLFATTIALTRLLAPREFGVVAAGLAVVVFLEVGLDLGVGASLVYEQERGITQRVQTAFTVNLAVAAVLTAAAELAAPAIATLFRVPDAVGLLRVLFLYLLVRGAGQVQDAVLRRDLGFRSRALVEVSRAVVRAGVTIPLAAGGSGAWSIVLGLLAGEIVATALASALVRFRPTFTLDRSALRSLVGFGLAVFALKVVDAIALDSDYVVVGARLGPTELGYYTVAYRLPELLLLSVYWIFSTVAFPVYARYREQGAAALAGAMLRALRLITLFSFPAGLGLALASRDTVLVLFGERWLPAAAPMALISLMTALSSIGYASGDIFAATGRPGTLLALNVPVTAVMVGVMVAVAPYGITAVAAVHLGVNVMYAPARVVLAARRVGVSLGASLAALRPGCWAAAGVLVTAGPVRLLHEPGATALVATVVMGAVGGLAAVWVGDRTALREVLALRRSVAGV